MVETDKVPCGLCDTLTDSTGTERCNRCWELERRIERDPALARLVWSRRQPRGIGEVGTKELAWRRNGRRTTTGAS
jgi:hypothetical protein